MEPQQQQEKMQCIYDIDNTLDINNLPDCVTSHEKQRANASVEKETPVNNFANNLDQQETRNRNISLDTRQTLANGSNIYHAEQMKKHLHRIEKLEFLIK